MNTTVIISEPILISLSRYEIVNKSGHVRENARISAKTWQRIDGTFSVFVSVERFHEGVGIWHTNIHDTIEGLFNEVMNEYGTETDEVSHFVQMMVEKLHKDEAGHEVPERYFSKHMTWSLHDDEANH